MEQQAVQATAGALRSGTNGVGDSAPPVTVVGTAIDLFEEQVKKSGPRVAMRYKKDGSWRELTYAEWGRAAREIAAGLAAAGIERGDRVCLLADSRPEWLLADLGIVLAGAVTVPIYQSNTPKECAYIVADAGAKAIFAEDPAQLEKLFAAEARGQVLARAPIVIVFEERVRFDKPDAKGRLALSFEEAVAEADRGRVRTLGALREEGAAFLTAQPDALAERARAGRKGDVFTIVYTSGTTGDPKGVVLTHENILFECEAVKDVLPIGPDDEQLLFLPLAHIFAKILEWSSIKKGARIAFAESLAKLRENLAEVRPTFLGAVPRVYEKFYAAIQQALKEAPGPKRRLMSWAFAVGARVSRERQKGRPVGGLLKIQHDFAERLVLGKLKKKLGLDRIKFMVSGAAPLAREIAELFHAVGIVVLEGYGLTETTAGTNINRPERFRFGTVGPAVPGVEIKIAPEDGEILVRGGLVMRGYYNRPEESAAVLDADGFFHTGDIGEIEDGFLRITDRKKDLIVTAGGKKVAPQQLEGQLKTLSPLVSQVLVHGDKRKFVSALVTVNEESLVKWAAAKGLTGDYRTLVATPDLLREIQAAVDEMNRGLASYAQVKKIAILPADLTREAGELTPTLKVKRKLCTEKYKSLFDGFYA